MLNDSINSVLGSINSTPLTPFNICLDMISLLDTKGFFDKPDDDISMEEYISSHRVCDFYCKSGDLLAVCYFKFVKALSDKFKTPEELDYFIWRHLLYAICPSTDIAYMLTKKFYGNNELFEKDDSILGHFYVSSMCGDKDVENHVPEELKDMKFDVIVGNPPYNDDIYLDFVEKGHQMSNDYSLWVTPAKWQARQYFDIKFRSIFGNISDIVYFIDTDEVFQSIREWGGIAYYLIGKESSSSIDITTKCRRNNNLSKRGTAINLDTGLHIYAFSILNKVSSSGFNTNSRFARYQLKSMVSEGKYMTILPNTYSTTSGRLSDDGAYFVLSPLYVDTKLTGDNNKAIFKSDNIDECNSVASYFSTRFIRFLMHLSLCKQHPLSYKWCDDTFLFVPVPQSHNIVYEDSPLNGYIPDDNGEYIDNNGVVHCSLYAKYKLTDDEIKVIESVIRDRN